MFGSRAVERHRLLCLASLVKLALKLHFRVEEGELRFKEEYCFIGSETGS